MPAAKKPARKPVRKPAKASRKPSPAPAKQKPFECTALLLQGGGALGAYQAGVYQALSEAGVEPDWVAGISIGAVNAAIIVGNPPEKRVAKLREFWEFVTVDSFQYSPDFVKALLTQTDSEFKALNDISGMRSLLFGIKGFFQPRMLTPWLEPKGSLAATSFCDTSQLKATLKRVIDFKYLNESKKRFNIGAVHVTSGNFTNFCNQHHTITPEHIMASGALPPGLPPVKIDGEYYWDGGLISNTPLHWVVEDEASMDTLVFQVDLWSADGEFPQNIADVFTRQKDIQFSSRTRASTERFKNIHELRHNIADLLEKLPASLRHSPEARKLVANGDRKVYNIVHLIYHNKSYEGYSKDFEFSRLSMEAHWQTGYTDTLNTLRHKQVLERPHNKAGIAIFDYSGEVRANEKKAKAL